MSDSLMHKLRSYFGYIIASGSKHKVHSPFIYDLITKVLEDRSESQDYTQIHSCYRELCRSSRVMETTDFGVSENVFSYVTKFLTVSQVAKKSSIRQAEGKLLYRLAKYFKPANILELGTACGISALYLAKGAPGARLITMEGCAAKADLAKSNFKKLDADNIEVSTGRFDTQLPAVFEKMPVIDLVFMDGHHRYKPTLEYFRRIITKTHEDSLVVIDDIHWSPGMERAWEEIQKMPEVIVTVDLYHLGLVFFRKGLSKQHFILRF